MSHTRTEQYAYYSILDEGEVKDQALSWLRKCAYGNNKDTLLTERSFMEFVCTELLSSCDLPNAPTQISLRSTYRWMHKMGFTYQHHKKGTFVDGHVREDVVSLMAMKSLYRFVSDIFVVTPIARN